MTPALLSAFLVLGAADPAPSFETQVAPLLQSHCLKCHNPVKLRGGLDLTTRTGMLKGGEAGAVVVPGKSADSLLYAKVHDGKMPPGRAARRRPRSSCCAAGSTPVRRGRTPWP